MGTISSPEKLLFKPLGIDSQYEHIIFMREDCPVCISEGFEALTRVRVRFKRKSIVATLNVLRSDLLHEGEVSLSERACKILGLKKGDLLTVSHLSTIESLSLLRGKIFNTTLSQSDFDEIIKDIVKGHYSNIHLTAFVTACSGDRLSKEEIVFLTRAMIKNGNVIKWEEKMIVDKHCIGGLPGNRTTPVIVAILTSLGLVMPKTSSRAITSPAGTADMMEVMAPVNLSMNKIKKVVKKEGGCIVWGGSADLSPADDILIRVEKALDIDSEGQMIASVLSKKVAAGSTHVVLDMPVGETAKIRGIEAANQLKIAMEHVGRQIGLNLKIIITDGSQPVGKGIGPSLEAFDVLSVLRNDIDAPADLKERSLLLAGELLELSGRAHPGEGNEMARQVLESGKALEKFMEICKAQGGFRNPEYAPFKEDIKSEASGTVRKINNRKLAKIAKLAGAPQDKRAGIQFYSPLEKKIKKGDVLFSIFAESKGELNYALDYFRKQKDIIEIKKDEK